jgi:hypothetical protein
MTCVTRARAAGNLAGPLIGARSDRLFGAESRPCSDSYRTVSPMARV